MSGLDYLLKQWWRPCTPRSGDAEQCLQLAQDLAPQHRNLLLKWADEWNKVAEELEELEGQDAQEEQLSNKQKNGGWSQNLAWTTVASGFVPSPFRDPTIRSLAPRR